MKSEKVGIGFLYVAAGVFFSNALWFFPQAGDNHVASVIFLLIGIVALLAAICAHEEE